MQRGSLQTYYEALDTTIKPKSGPQIRSDKKSSCTYRDQWIRKLLNKVELNPSYGLKEAGIKAF